MDSFGPYPSLLNPGYYNPAGYIFPSTEPLFPPQEWSPSRYTQNFHHSLPVAPNANKYQLYEKESPAGINPDISPRWSAVRAQNFCSRWDLSAHHLVPVSHILPTTHHYEAHEDTNITASPCTFSLEQDFNIQSSVPRSSTVSPKELVDVEVQQDWQSFHRLLESRGEGGGINLNDQNCHSVADNESRSSCNDFDLSDYPASPLIEPQTDKLHPQLLAPQTASRKSAHRTVGSAAIVSASRKRRGVDEKTGIARVSRFSFSEPRCVELGIGFTSKQTYDGTRSIPLTLR
ncbi:hypothetical protein GYMLUDRAFT_65413 [Collybiopsis luxurians FD-317 M1]|uniref:Uncharacterized protein n=1 Tax=Collybiopsis luxurians FD-317 M1 TaxID=944289 RepID=A0A0D0C5Y1_9AGAR|nr:hypothetical protein GYMLUDRAFT_65413 [Collybiopsis luxurians FD-317 M1]